MVYANEKRGSWYAHKHVDRQFYLYHKFLSTTNILVIVTITTEWIITFFLGIWTSFERMVYGPGIIKSSWGKFEKIRKWKNWCFQTVGLEKTLENLLDSKDIKPVNPKGNQPWIFIGRTDAEAETPNTFTT